MKIVKGRFPRRTWLTGDGHAAQTATLRNLMGLITRIDIVISEVTDNPTVTVAFADSAGLAIIPSFATLADGTHHVKLARSNKSTPDADFNPLPVCQETLTATVDPSADPGGSAQTLTVDVILYLEK
jgi:hypothetical protein